MPIDFIVNYLKKYSAGINGRKIRDWKGANEKQKLRGEPEQCRLI